MHSQPLSPVHDIAEFRSELSAIHLRLQNRAPNAPIKLFVLIDFTRVPDWAVFEEQLHSSARIRLPAVNLYDDLAGLELAKSGPRLLALDLEDEVMDAVMGLAIEHEAGSFLFASCTLNELAEHLRSIREVAMPDSGGALFRFQDMHVTAALWPLLSPTQKNRILGPARAWVVREACGELHLIEALFTHKRTSTLSFDRKIVTALDDALFPWTVADQINEIDTALLAGLSPCARLTLLRERIAHAKTLGLRQPSDLSLYCALSLQLPEGFETHPPFARAFESARSGQSSLGVEIDRITPEQWQHADEILEGTTR